MEKKVMTKETYTEVIKLKGRRRLARASARNSE